MKKIFMVEEATRTYCGCNNRSKVQQLTHWSSRGSVLRSAVLETRENVEAK